MLGNHKGQSRTNFGIVSNRSLLRGWAYSRHELATPEPSSSTTDQVTKNCPADTVLVNLASSHTCFSLTASGRFVNSWSSFCTKFLRAMVSKVLCFVRRDTSSGGTSGAASCSTWGSAAGGVWLLRQCFAAPWTLSWLTEIVVCNKNYAVWGSALRCIEVLLPPLLVSDPMDKGLVPRNTRWPLSANFNIISFAIRFQSLSSS